MAGMVTDNTTDYTTPILLAVEAAEGRLPAKKRLLVSAAVECFAEHGFAATSTRMIASRAGVAEATIFRHYQTKKDLLVRLVEPVLDQLILPGMDAQLTEIHPQKIDLAELVRWVMANRLAYAREFAPLVRIVVQELPVNTELRAMVVGKLGTKIKTIIASEIRRLAPDLRLTPTEIDRMLRTVVSLLVGIFLAKELGPPDQSWDDEAEVDAAAEMIIRTYLTPPKNP